MFFVVQLVRYIKKGFLWLERKAPKIRLLHQLKKP